MFLLPSEITFTVCNFYIAEIVLRKNHSGDHGKRGVDFSVLAVDLHGLFLIVGVVDADLYLSALTGQIFRRNLLTVQIIGQLYSNRKFLIRGTLIVNIGAIGLARSASRHPG